MYVIVKTYFIISLRFLYGYLIRLPSGIASVNDRPELKGNDVTRCSLQYRTISENTRFWCEIVGAMFWTTGLVVMPGVAYLLQNYSWRYLQIALSCFSLLSLILSAKFDSILLSI